MHFLRATSLVVLGAVAVAAPTVPKPLSYNGITVSQVSADVPIYQDVIPHKGLTQYAKAISKYGASKAQVDYFHDLAKHHGKSVVVSREVEDPVEEDGVCPSGSQTSGPLVAIPNAYDKQYLTQIFIGGRPFWMDFDTGSADFWVVGPNVVGLSANQTVWEPSASSKQLPGESFLVGYGDGSIASGSVWTDDVLVGSVNIPNAVVEIATIAQGSFDPPLSGVLGLGFDSQNMVMPVPQKTLFTTMITSGLISRPVLSADLKHDAPGLYTFGDTPLQQYSGDITYTSVNSTKGYWQISPSSVAASGTNFLSSTTSSLVGIMDTGTTLILLDDNTVAGYWSTVPGAILDISIYGGWVFDCGTQLPDFEVVVGGLGSTYTVTVPGTYMSYEPISNGKCFGALQPTFESIPFGIYGDILIKSAFVVFDRGSDSQGPRVGFADKATQ